MTQILLLTTALLFSQGVLGAPPPDCGETTIASAADAEAVGKACTVINGNLTFSANESVVLDGVQVVNGYIANLLQCHLTRCDDSAPLNISMPALTTVHGYFGFYKYPYVESLSMPKLSVVDGTFSVTQDNLTTLDITSLQSVGSFLLTASSLTTLRHTALRNLTLNLLEIGVISVTGVKVDNLDSIYSVPLNLSNSAVDLYDAPNVKKLTLGMTATTGIFIRGGQDMDVVFGGPNTTSMDIGSVTIEGDVRSLQRAASLKSLSVSSFEARDGSSMTHLTLPFDSLTSINVDSEKTLEVLELPKQAVGWEMAQLRLINNTNLNLTSQFTPDATGQLVQTWYWPEKDINSIVVFGNITEMFFQSFLDAEVPKINASGATSNISYFEIVPDNSKLFNCTLFDELSTASILPKGAYAYYCGGTKGKSSSAYGITSSTWMVAVAVVVSVAVQSWIH